MRAAITLALILPILSSGCSALERGLDAVIPAAFKEPGRPKVTRGQAIPREFIDKNDVRMVRHYLDKGAAIDAPVDVGASALMISIGMRASAVTDLLLKRGADVNRAATPSGETPLMSAVIVNQLPLGKRLVKLGAKPKAESKGGRTAMGVAAHMGYDDWVTFLLKSGVDVNAANKKGLTALHQACSQGRESTVKLLLGKRAKPDLTTPQNRSPLFEAARSGSVECVKLLVARGADVNRTSRHYRETPLLVATMSRRAEVVKFLLARGADPSARDDKGRTALDHARNSGDRTLVRLLK